MKLRVIIDGPRDPRINMSIDEAILRLRPSTGVDTLRLYTWKPTGVTIGRSQRIEKAINLGYIREKGYIAVRRPTGGRALLHAEEGEVTYSLVLSSSSPLYKLDVAESAARIARGIVEALRLLGLEAGIGGYKGLGGEELCYLREGASDVTVRGFKVSGSAQVRLSHGLLQHGTLLLDFDPEEWTRVIPTSIDPGQLAGRVAGLRQLGLDPSLGRVLEVLVQGFSRALGAEHYMGGLTAPEVEEANRLYREKYSTRQWNMQGYAGTG